MLAALTAGIVALAAQSLPYKIGLMLAVLTGITVGVISERYSAGARAVDVPAQEVDQWNCG